MSGISAEQIASASWPSEASITSMSMLVRIRFATLRMTDESSTIKQRFIKTPPRPRRGGPPASGLNLHGYRKQPGKRRAEEEDRKSTRLNSSHVKISYAVF